MWPAPSRRQWLGILAGTVLAVVLAGTPNPALAQVASPPPEPLAAQAGPPPAQGPDVEPGRAVPVLLGGEPVVWIAAGVGQYTPEVRAARIAGRLEELIHHRSIRDASVAVVSSAGSSELRVQGRLLMVVTERDAQIMGVSRDALAQQAARTFEAAIRAERLRYAPTTLTRRRPSRRSPAPGRRGRPPAAPRGWGRR